MHLFENVMIGTMGADKWNGLWTTPPTTDWTGADVTAGIANYAKALSYTNSDASTLSDWQPASKMVADGDAAFNIMGDWAYGYFANPAPNGLALKPHTDFDWAVSPGTYGIFNFLSDSFVLPVGNKHPAGTMAWLTVAASKAGQEAFNPLKGSICARTDCDPVAVQRILAGCCQGLDGQYCGRQPDARRGCQSNLEGRHRHRTRNCS